MLPEKGKKVLATLLVEGNIGGIMDKFTEMEKVLAHVFYSIITTESAKDLKIILHIPNFY